MSNCGEIDAPLECVVAAVEKFHNDNNHGLGAFVQCLREPCYSVLQAHPQYEAANKPDWIPAPGR